MRDQAANLRDQLNSVTEPKHAKTIAVVSGKGGVGKSNITINFAIELARAEKSVLVFDLDVGMGNINILLGNASTFTILDLLRQRLPINQVITEGPKGLHYIAGGSSLGELVAMEQTDLMYFLQQLQYLSHHYDYILFDMGAGVSQASLSFILAAEICITVTTLEPTAITDAYGMIKQIVNKQRNMPIYVVMNRSSSSKQGMRAMKRFQMIVDRFLHVPIYPLAVLPMDKHVPQAVMKQTPFVLLNEQAAISKAIRHMSQQFLQTMDREKSANQDSFVKKITRFLVGRSKK